MKLITVISAAALLAGCIVRPTFYPPPTYVDNAYVAYPVIETEYAWDPEVNCYFFFSGGYRYYMEPGWNFHRGIPGHYWHSGRRGYYRR